MRRLMTTTWALVALGGWVVSAEAAILADRSADEILKELRSVKPPALDAARRSDQTYIQEYVKQRSEALQRRAALILELYKADPDHREIAPLMAERWNTMRFLGGKEKLPELKKEIEQAIASAASEKLKVEAMFAKARVALFETDGGKDLHAVDEFIKAAPRDSRCVSLLYMAASVTRDEKAKAALEDRILKEYANSAHADRIKDERRQRELIGKPFELEFTDAISGSTVSMKGLKGKLVIIDFWATWCGPCVDEMPRMKRLYAEYHDRGVEFIGISLDAPREEGGLTALKKFVKENEIPWPQYYQGNGWNSKFSSSWEIHAIPTMFLIDAEGKVNSLNARPNLEELIPKLLKNKEAKSGAKAGAGAGGE